mgnify:CR=1 FL=1
MLEKAKYTGECFIIKAIGRDEDGRRVIHTEYHDVLEGQDPEEVAKKADNIQRYLKFRKGFEHVFVYRAFQRYWDGEKVTDSPLLAQRAAS